MSKNSQNNVPTSEAPPSLEHAGRPNRNILSPGLMPNWASGGLTVPYPNTAVPLMPYNAHQSLPLTGYSYQNSQSPVQPTPSSPRQASQPPPTKSAKYIDPEKIFSLLVLDFLRRRGYNTTAAQFTNEARIDFFQPDMAETLAVFETLNSMHGRNPQPGGVENGFLRDWFNTFWQVYQNRISSAQMTAVRPSQMPLSRSPMQPTPASPNIPMAVDNSPDAAASQMQAKMKLAVEARRRLINHAMTSLGLIGRDPASLSPEEQKMVSLTIHQILSSSSSSRSPPYAAQGNGPEERRKQPRTQDANIAAAQQQQQQFHHLRGMQMQQAQYQPPGFIPQQPTSQLPIVPSLSTSSSSQAQSRPILPSPVTKSPTIPAASNANKSTNNIGRVASATSLKSTDSAVNDLDESALFNFFGSPSEWLSGDKLINDQEATGTGTAIESGNGSDLKYNIDSHTFNESSSTFLIDAAPFPEHSLSLNDPSDLLLVSETHEEEVLPQVTTTNGFTLREVAVLGQHSAGSKAVTSSISLDGLLLASGGNDKKILIFSLIEGNQRLLGEIEGHSAQVTQVRFATVGAKRYLASASFDKTVLIWDLGEKDCIPETIPKQPLFSLKDEHDEPVWSIDFISYDTEQLEGFEGGLMPRIASIDASGKLIIWDIGQSSSSALFSTVIKTADDRAISVRQIKSRPYSVGANAILAIANDTSVVLFDVDSKEIVDTLLVSTPVGDQKGKAVVALNWGGVNLLAAATAEVASIWDMTGSVCCPSPGSSVPTPPKIIASLSIPADKITCCTFVGETGCLAIGGYQGIRLWEYQCGPEYRTRVVKFPAHEGLVASLSNTRTGIHQMGSASHDGWIRLWTVEKIPQSS